MSTSAKLTKKQKKAIAFRERKQGKTHKDAPDARDIPIAENQDLADVQGDDVEDEAEVGRDASRGSRLGKGKDSGAERKQKGKQKDESEKGDVERPGKRKREGNAEAGKGDDADEGEERKQKRKKRAAGDTDGAGDGKAVEKELKLRFILFVGNLKYTTSLEDITKHFAACDPPPTVRLLTPKTSSQKSSSQKTTAKSKGCAFLEFSHRNALQQALKLHQSELDGRRINVELTAGGGGKSETRLGKLRQRNKELHGQRTKRIEKQAASADNSRPLQSERPQRYSATSGIEQENAGKRTWTVGDTEDDSATHRGGRKHVRGSKKGRTQAKDWGTGVNAIPVG